MTDTDATTLATMDATAQAELVRNGDASPSELVEAAIARVEQLNPELNAVIHELFEEGRAEAESPDLPDGPFKGVPFLFKDLGAAYAGQPLHLGMRALKEADFRAPVDSYLAQRFRAAGFVVIGKTNVPELGILPTTEPVAYGPSRNPWNTDHTPGGSSGGSGAAVASGMVPVAHANDGGGSIRIPASVNGLVGLKPTRDRLAQDAVMRQMPVRIISDGVVTRSVRDTAAFFREAEKVYRAVHLPPIGDLTRPGRGRLRIGVHTEGVGRGANPEVTELTLKVATVLEELGHHVEPVDAPVGPSFPDDFLLYWSSMALFLKRGGRRLHGRSWNPARLDTISHGLAAHARRHLHRLPGAVRRLRRSRLASAEFFGKYDVALTPTLATETPQIGWLDPTQDYDVLMDRILDWVAFTPLQNATGDPAISLPLATTAAGLPQGMMFGAGAGREATLIGLAFELEEALPFARIDG